MTNSFKICCFWVMTWLTIGLHLGGIKLLLVLVFHLIDNLNLESSELTAELELGWSLVFSLNYMQISSVVISNDFCYIHMTTFDKNCQLMQTEGFVRLNIWTAGGRYLKIWSLKSSNKKISPNKFFKCHFRNPCRCIFLIFEEGIKQVS